MIRYEVSSPSGVTVVFLRDFENTLYQYIKGLLNQSEFNNLRIEYQLTLKKGDIHDDVCKVVSNASLAIRSSNAFTGKMEDYISNHIQELKACIGSTQFLEIKLIYSLRDDVSKKSEGPKKGNKDNNDLTFVPISPKYTFEQVILPAKLKEEIEEALNVIRYQDLIYKTWGFGKVDPTPKSVLNFYGPPGTGKTMCAHAIAKKIGKKLLALNYAEIESKYVGEAPKNLMKAFEIAEQEDCVMFFDEADSFLGKRIQNVTQGADQALNSLRSQMLILLENHSGVVIFATNLVTNFDKAFESRILKHLKFDLPNKEARTAIIKSMLPAELPLAALITEEEFDALGEATDGLAGREIKNAILSALLTKATKFGEQAVFTFTDFEESFRERQKMLKDLKDEALKEKKEKIMKALAKNPDVVEKAADNLKPQTTNSNDESADEKKNEQKEE